MGSCASSPIQTSTDRLVGHCLSADEKARLASWEAWLDVFQSVSTCEVAAVKQFAAYLTAQRFENPDDLLASHDKVESELKTRGFARDGIARMFLKAAAWSDSLEILPDLCGIISPLGASPPAVISHTHDDILYPRYITASSGLIFISDGRQIHCLRTTGASLHSFPIQEAYRTSSKSAGLCFAKGLLYVSAHPSSQILVFRTDGTLVSKWEVPFQPWGIAYGDGLFFVSDAACSQVHILTCDGQLLRSFGPGYDYDRKSFVASPGITFSQHHVFVIFDQEVSMYRTDGSFVRHIVSKEHTNSDQPINPWDLAVCGDRVLVTDSEGSIFIYSLDGAFINYLDFSVKSHGYSAVVAKGVCASAGSVFVVDRGISMTRRIRAIPESTVLSVAPVADE